MMTKKEKHNIIMWSADFIGSMFGGMIVASFFGIVFVYGLGLDKVMCQ